MSPQEVDDHIKKLTASKNQLQSLQAQEAALSATVKAKLEGVHQQLTAAGLAEGLEPSGDIEVYLAEANARIDSSLSRVAQVLGMYQAALSVPVAAQAAPIPGPVQGQVL
jgi:hypothetical protein